MVPDEATDHANAVMGRTLAIAEFTALGEVGMRLIQDAWHVPFLSSDQRTRLLDGLPDPDNEFEAFIQASGAERIRSAVLRDGWLETWLRGYFLGLARLNRENSEFGRHPHHTWQSPRPDQFYRTYTALGRLGGGPDPSRTQRELRWLGYGALAPWTSTVIHGALAFVSSQQDDAILPLYSAGAGRVRAMYSLMAVATDGYAIARAQQELEVMNRFLADLGGPIGVDTAGES